LIAPETIPALVERAIAARKALFDPKHLNALRLFNGFLEGCPELVIDLYASTVVLHNYAEAPDEGLRTIQTAQAVVLTHLPWLSAGIVKTRNSQRAEEKRGKLLFGEKPDTKVLEQGILYTLDL